MNRFSMKALVLTMVSCYGCSADSTSTETAGETDLSNRQSTIIISRDLPPESDLPESNDSSINDEGDEIVLSEEEKQILELANDQVLQVIDIVKKIVDADTAAQSVNSLCEARSALQKTRNELRHKVSSRQQQFLLFNSDEGKALQEAMWTMKNELARLEGDEEIQAILTDGMSHPPLKPIDSELAHKERKELTVTASASNVNVISNPVSNANSENSTEK